MNDNASNTATVEQEYPIMSRYVDAAMDPELERDPGAVLGRLAGSSPVIKMENGTIGGIKVPDNFMFADVGREVYFVLSYNAVRQLAMDAKTFSNESYATTLRQTFGETLMSLDGERHIQLKRLVLPTFSHSIVNEDLVKIAAPVIETMLDRIMPNGKGELVGEFCAIFPFVVIARIFGVPDEFAAEAENLVVAASTMHEDPERALAALGKMDALYQKVVDAHRDGSRDDMTWALMNSEVDGRRLTDNEVVGFIKQVIAAGLDTTARATATFLYLMLENPDQFDDLKANPDLLENAIYEAMRLQAAGGFIPRVAMCDTVLEGVKIPKGAGVYGVIHSANRDASRWEDPDRFDIRRKRQQFMTFGAGPHSCLGANLSIAEQLIALKGVLARLKNLRKDTARWGDTHIHGFQLRSPTKLPVLWDV